MQKENVKDYYRQARQQDMSPTTDPKHYPHNLEQAIQSLIERLRGTSNPQH